MADCIDWLMQRFGINQNQAVSIMVEVKKERARVERNIKDIDRVTQQLLSHLKTRTMTAGLEAAAHKRALTLQYARRLEAFDLITEKFEGMEEEGLSALLVGTNRVRDGARFSVDAAQTSLRGYYIGGLIADIEALGDVHLKMLQRGVLDQEIARALWATDADGNLSPSYQGPKEAKEIAGAIWKWQEKARQDANLAGAWIGNLPGYIVRQSHDRDRIARVGAAEWIKDADGLLDWNETANGSLATADPDTRQAWLSEVYKNLALARIPIDNGNPLTNAFGQSRIGSTAARMSHDRVLHFKDADSWFQYNQKYGRSNLREALIDGLTSSANQTALMRRLGPSPSAQVDALYSMLERAMRNAGDLRGIRRLQNARNRINNQLKEVDGTLNISATPWIAAVGRNLRAWTSMTKLGGAVISAISDVPIFSSEMAYQGRSFLGTMARGIGDMLHGRGTKEQQKILSQLGVFFNGMCDDIISRVSGDETPGMITKMQTMFFKLNGLTWWTDTWRRVAGLMMSHELALEKDVAWADLSSDLRKVLGQYGIREAEWDVCRKGSLSAADGKEYLTPEGIAGLSDTEIAQYMRNTGRLRGKTATDAAIQTTRAELEDRLRTYFRDRINFAVLEPDAKTRAIMRQGTSAGTIAGELMRFITQFKAFPVSYVQKVLGRETYGREGEGKGQVMMSMARLLLMTTLFGYGAMVTKDIFKGKTPRDPSDPKTWGAAFTQGGGAGIFGDLLFGEYNRFGQSWAATAAGPTAGTISDIANIYARVRDGDSVGQAALRVLYNTVPGTSLFYLRGPLDYLLMYNLFDMINPGFFRRQKRRVERQNGQTYWASPVTWR